MADNQPRSNNPNGMPPEPIPPVQAPPFKSHVVPPPPPPVLPPVVPTVPHSIASTAKVVPNANTVPNKRTNSESLNEFEIPTAPRTPQPTVSTTAGPQRIASLNPSLNSPAASKNRVAVAASGPSAKATGPKSSTPRGTTPQATSVASENETHLDSEETFTEWLAVKYLRDAPSWLISTLVHIAIILLLALIPLRDEVAKSFVLLLGNSEAGAEGDALTSFNISEMESLQGENDSDALDDLSVSASDLATTMPDLTQIGSNVAVPEFSIRKGLTGRTGTMKGALLKAFGGNERTEQAVALGLEWLKKNQSSDGSWSMVQPYSDGGTSENRSAATALALLAFMGAGNTHKSGDYQSNVFRGLNYLLSVQDSDGFFANKATTIQRTYAQAQSTIAVCELFGMTADPKLKEPAELAVRYSLSAQDDGGGWRYNPKETGDTSVTGWYVMALISARMAGIEVPSDNLERIHQFLDTVQRKEGLRGANPDGELYAYQAFSPPKDSMTAEGMLCRMYLGWRTEDKRIVAGCEHIARHPIVTSIEGRDYYYWYYATNALHHAGGSTWRKWNDVMKEALPALQIQAGRERGSWPPQGDPHGAAGGRLYATVLSILCLEAYYRHMPLSEMAPASQPKSK
ncbi:MAG: squalene--hopene cyclase [Planctomycetes bacterium]|nr:squalene--hopene cyclase [Planctomycetota bacterium]